MKFLISVFLVVSLYAKVIDKIEILVNNIPITSYDIEMTQKKLNISKKEAISYLIDKAILNSAIKERGIYVDEFDIDNAMKKIAQKNGMSLFNFKNYLLQKGELDKLKEEIKNNIQKQRLLQSLNLRVERKDVENYYKTHKNEFMLPSKIEVTEYSANNKNDLLQVLQNPLSSNPNVSIKDIIFEADKTNPRLMQFLVNVKEGSFSPIVNLGGKFVSFYVVKKSDMKTIDLKMVEGAIYQKLIDQKSKQLLNDYIAKLRAKADIEFLN